MLFPYMALNVWVYVFLPIALICAYVEGRKRTVGYIGAFLLFFLLTPLFGFLIVSMFPLKNRRGCQWCGNKYNEAEYCGICGKNEAGEINPWITMRQKK